MAEASDKFPSVARTRAEITACRMVARSTLLIELRMPELSKQASPGQFVMLGPLREDSCDPFLNRPFSIHRCSPDGRLELLVGVVGRGTEMLQAAKPGERIWVLGPLGNGFSAPEECDLVLLVGGGLGVAPLFFLAERMAALGKSVRLLYGAATKDDLVPTKKLESVGVQIRHSTDDGTHKTHGSAVDLLNTEMSGLSNDGPGKTYLAACGPQGMLRAAWESVGSRAPQTPFEVSLEIRMACGMGACMGCTVFLADGLGRRVCCEGPVFRA